MFEFLQDYSCSAEEDAMAGGRMACEVDSGMEMRAFTQADFGREFGMRNGDLQGRLNDV